jgi:hypothetical protein
MGYSVAALYLAGAGALIVGDPFWKGYSVAALILLLTLLAMAALLAFLLVREQLKLRRAAGEMFRACSRVLTRWLVSPPDRAALNASGPGIQSPLFSGFIWPLALEDEIRQIQTRRKRIWWPRDLTYASMGLSAIIVLTRILITWQP